MENTKGIYIVLLVFAGIVIGVLFTLGITQPWVKQVQTSQQWPAIELRPSSVPEVGKPVVNTPNVTNTNIQELIFATPKSSVTQGYHDAFNALIKKTDSIETLNNEKLTPLLKTMNEKNIAGEYAGFFDLIVEAKNLNKEQKNHLDEFQSNLDRLRNENQKTKDTAITVATAKFLLAGTEFHGAFVRYATVLDALLNGPRPDARLIQELQASIDGTQKASGGLVDALEKLEIKIGERIKTDTQKK